MSSESNEKLIALAAPRIATSIEDGLAKVAECLADAAGRGAVIACFPEAYLPGLRGQDFAVPSFERAQQEQVLAAVAQLSRRYNIATILGMEWLTERGRQIVAVVVSARGELLGYQTKNQLAPFEDLLYVPGDTRRLFAIDGLRFGIAICHEAWRYPETVRWAAVRGARIVFQPQHTGSDITGRRLTQWGAAENPYYEKAMICRSIENTIYFASVNYGMRYQESATCLIAPTGEFQAALPYGQAGVLVQRIDLTAATGLLAARYAPERYAEHTATHHL